MADFCFHRRRKADASVHAMHQYTNSSICPAEQQYLKMIKKVTKSVSRNRLILTDNSARGRVFRRGAAKSRNKLRALTFETFWTKEKGLLVYNSDRSHLIEWRKLHRFFALRPLVRSPRRSCLSGSDLRWDLYNDLDTI